MSIASLLPSALPLTLTLLLITPTLILGAPSPQQGLRHAIHFKCGHQTVSHAKINFYERGGDFDDDREIHELHHLTDGLGHYSFPDYDFSTVEFHNIHLTLSDMCMVPKEKIECNMPYYKFDIPLRAVLKSAERDHRHVTLDLTDTQWHPFRHLHCH